MKAKMKIEREVEIRSIIISVEPRYIGDDEDSDMSSDFPLLDESKTLWTAHVNIDTGLISGWPIGEKRKAFIKVCDAGQYTLVDSDGNHLKTIEGYVPNGIIPGEYGDYIDLDIDENGFIANWPKRPDISAFLNDDED